MTDPTRAMPAPAATPLSAGPRPIAVGVQRTKLLEPPDAYRAIFARWRAIECADIVEPGLLAALLARCRDATFVPDRVDGIGSREIEAPQHVGRILNLALGGTSLLRWVEAATGCEGLVGVEGRVVQTRANGTDGLDWHNDLHDRDGDGRRRLGITVNLSDGVHDGGDFELRDTTTRAILATYHHHRTGTALIFDVAHDLDHRVLPITRGGPRRVFTGWFLQAAPSRQAQG